MKRIEVTSSTKSKKGTIWVQVKVLDGEAPKAGEIFQCEKVGEAVKGKEEEAETH